jgi:hypothetical protein
MKASYRLILRAHLDLEVAAPLPGPGKGQLLRVSAF